VPVEIGLSPIETSDGSLVLAAVTDISARKLAEAAEAAAREDAERANRIKDEFLSVLSHELRTPLNATLGWASLLATGDLDLETSRRAIEAIERNARAEARLVDALLDLSRVMAGKLELERARMDLAELVRVAGESLRPEAESKGIALTVVGPPVGTLPVVGDWNRLQQVIWNLLSNALKFTPRGGHVELSVERAGERAQIEVSDDGKGIRAEFLTRVFDRFSQETTAGGVRVGLGLGLAIVKELAQAHGGTVGAHSDGEGCGSRFTVSLPLAPALHAELSVRAGVEPVPSLGGLDLLVVEDDADALEVFARLLRARGADVRTATTAAEALHLVRGRRPHLVVTDLRMPRVDGYALLGMMRLLGGTPIPAVAVSAEAGEAERARALAAGFVAHVGKPVEPAELVRVVAAHARRAPG
jgi:CheY-like chemotaxis protein